MVQLNRVQGLVLTFPGFGKVSSRLQWSAIVLMISLLPMTVSHVMMLEVKVSMEFVCRQGQFIFYISDRLIRRCQGPQPCIFSLKVKEKVQPTSTSPLAGPL